MYKNSGSSEYPTKNLELIKNKFTISLVMSDKKSQDPQSNEIKNGNKGVLSTRFDDCRQ